MHQPNVENTNSNHEQIKRGNTWMGRTWSAARERLDSTGWAQGMGWPSNAGRARGRAGLAARDNVGEGLAMSGGEEKASCVWK